MGHPFVNLHLKYKENRHYYIHLSKSICFTLLITNFYHMMDKSPDISCGITLFANLIPPLPGPVEVLSTTKTPFINVSGS
jgi:hypothetical protein